MLDTAYTDLDDTEVSLIDPATGRRVTLRMDGSYRWLMLFTGDTLRPDRRRRGLAVEPITCPPNAFVSGEGLRNLDPGESETTSWGVASG